MSRKEFLWVRTQSLEPFFFLLHSLAFLFTDCPYDRPYFPVIEFHQTVFINQYLDTLNIRYHLMFILLRKVKLEEMPFQMQVCNSVKGRETGFEWSLTPLTLFFSRGVKRINHLFAISFRELIKCGLFYCALSTLCKAGFLRVRVFSG